MRAFDPQSLNRTPPFIIASLTSVKWKALSRSNQTQDSHNVIFLSHYRYGERFRRRNDSHGHFH